MTDLARRAVACKGWRWMPGMADTNGNRAITGPNGNTGWPSPEFDDEGGEWIEAVAFSAAALPDLTDPGTIGCLLALAREAWGQHYWVRWWRNPAPDMSGKDRAWCEVVDGIGRRLPGQRIHHQTEAEALVDALEAAP